MAIVGIPVLYGNSAGSKSLHGSNRKIAGRDWAARVPDQAAAINSSGCWIFNGYEIHAPDDEWKDSDYPAGGHLYLLDKLKLLSTDWAIAGGAEGNWTYYRPSRLSVVAVNNFHFSIYDRGLTDVTFQDTATGFQFHNLNSHFTAHKGKATVRKSHGKKVTTYSHDKARATQARETLKYMRDKDIKQGYFGGDINSSVYRTGFPRDIFTKGALLGLRERNVTIVNGGLSTFSTSAKQSYWLDDIFTRKNQSITGAELVRVNGVQGTSPILTDHNWLKATINFDAGALSGPTGPYNSPPSTMPSTPAPKPTGNPWVASVRDEDYLVGAPLEFTSATLVENYNQPDMLNIVGRTSSLAEVTGPSTGLILVDDQGTQRFSGQLTKIKRRGDGYSELSFTSDLIWLWWRKCYPLPGSDWQSQSAAYDVLSGTAEANLLSLVNRNLGPSATVGQPGVMPRRHPLLRTPTSQNRGFTTAMSMRFESLGDTCSTLAEQASLRMQISQTYNGLDPHLDLTLTDVFDLSDWVSFGIPEAGGPYMLSNAWSYEVDVPLGTTILSAAGGEGAARILTEATDGDAEDLWQARIEMFLNQQGTTDVAEINNGILKALADNAGPSLLSVPIGRVPGLGSTIPLGSQVNVQLDDLPIVDRIRQITTVLSNDSGKPAVTVTGVIGDPSAGVQTPTQRMLSRLLRRVQNLENT